MGWFGARGVDPGSLIKICLSALDVPGYKCNRDHVDYMSTERQ